MTKERILEILEGAKDETASVPISLVRKAFENISNESNWISCKERLPEDGQLVLSTADYGGWCFVGLDKYASVDGGVGCLKCLTKAVLQNVR